MSKQASLGAAERTMLVLRLLAKEGPAPQIACRAGVSLAQCAVQVDHAPYDIRAHLYCGMMIFTVGHHLSG